MSHSPAVQLERVTAEQLLDTAASLFRHKGFAATTTREIAAALGIQQASLYHHMASKEDLLYQICRSSIEQFLAEVPAALAGVECLEERIRLLIATHLAVLLRYQERNVTLLTELRAITRRRGAEMVGLRDRYEGFVRSTLAAAQAAGVLRGDVEAKYLSLALLGMLNYAALWFRRDLALSEARLAAVFTEVFLEGAAAKRFQVPTPDPEAPAEAHAARTRRTPRADRNPGLDRALDAAVGLFSRKGYDATSTREVAALLGMQKASLYYHISRKEDLLYLICTASLEQIRSDTEAAIAEAAEPLERVRALIPAHIESLLRDASKHATTFSEMRSLSAERRKRVLAMRADYENLVRHVLEEAQSAGVLRGDIAGKYLCLALLGMLNRTTVWYRRGGALSPAQVGRLLAAIFFAGARA